MRRRKRVDSSAAARCPATSTSPAVGSSSRLMSFSVVVLPDPLRPSKTRVSPRPTVKDTFCTRMRPSAGSAYFNPRTSRAAVLLGDADGDERRPGEAAVERVVVAGYGVLGGINLAVHQERVVRSQQRAQLARGGEWVEGAKGVAEQQDESRRRFGVRGEGREVIGARDIRLDPLGR